MNVAINAESFLDLAAKASIRMKPMSMEQDDAYQEAAIAIIKAADTFQEGRGRSFRTWAWLYIRSYFGHHYRKARMESQHVLHGFDSQVAEECMAATEEPLPLTCEYLEPALATLNAKQRHVLTERYCLNGCTTKKTLHEIGYQLGISRERVRQIEAKALYTLRKRIIELRAKESLR